jgi:hypothetical protein
MVSASELKFLENLAQLDYEGEYYDFHNDYDCERIVLNNNHVLTLQFKHTNLNHFVLFRFREVVIVSMDFFNVYTESLTLDNLYRGKVVIDEELVEISSDKKAYFYLEFDEGQKMEFWSKEIFIEKI